MLRYTLSLIRPWTHLFDVAITLETAGAEHLDIVFPAWSPGRYFIYDFARNVQELEAVGMKSRSLAVEKIAKGTWRIATKGHARITVSYRMFGDTLSGTFSQLDDRHASVNGSSVFGWIAGRETEPIELTIKAPKGWRAFTSLERKGSLLFAAENYDVLIDSPIEVGRPLERKFVVDEVEYHVIIDIAAVHAGSQPASALAERVERYVGDLQNIVRAYTTAFGRPEFAAYWFLVSLDPFAPNGDGMEHLASTRIVINASIMSDDVYGDLLDVSSHEFFHIWNVKRLRPAELGPFDYTSERHTTLLWFAEGFTQYYGHLMVRRAGAWDDAQLFKQLASEINIVERSPGRHHRNLRLSSFDTWNSARAPIGGASNMKNTYVNYYHKGAVTALLLDLEIRRRTGSRRSLDDVIRQLYRSSYAQAAHNGYFLRGTGFTEHDVLDAVEKVAGRAVRTYLAGLIVHTGELEYTRHLEYVGLELERAPRKGRRKKPGNDESRLPELPQIYTGLVMADTGARSTDPFVVVANVEPGSPADRAGFSAGDNILALDGERVDGKRWEGALNSRGPGVPMEVALFRGSRLLTLRLTPEEKDTRPYKITARQSETAAQKRARAVWLEGKKSGSAGSDRVAAKSKKKKAE